MTRLQITNSKGLNYIHMYIEGGSDALMFLENNDIRAKIREFLHETIFFSQQF